MRNYTCLLVKDKDLGVAESFVIKAKDLNSARKRLLAHNIKKGHHVTVIFSGHSANLMLWNGKWTWFSNKGPFLVNKDGSLGERAIRFKKKSKR